MPISTGALGRWGISERRRAMRLPDRPLVALAATRRPVCRVTREATRGSGSAVSVKAERATTGAAAGRATTSGAALATGTGTGAKASGTARPASATGVGLAIRRPT